jgi:RHS repeat-associated protein
VDADGAEIWRWPYKRNPFGELQPNGRQSYSLRFPGQYHDAESGLFYNLHRDYDPVVGRYIESDPKGIAGGINTYAYVNGNPLIYADPLGLEIGHAYAAIYKMDGGRMSSERVPLRMPDFVTFQVDAYVFSASATFTIYGDIFLGRGANRAYPSVVSGGVSISNGWVINRCKNGHPTQDQLNDFLGGYSGGGGGFWGVGGTYSAGPSGHGFNLGVGFGGFGISPVMFNSHQGNVFDGI